MAEEHTPCCFCWEFHRTPVKSVIHVIDWPMSASGAMNLRTVDLNLLVALDALLTVRHVSRAAVRVDLASRQ